MQNDRLVLVVSGDPEERDRAVAAVLDLGHAVLCADTGDDALAVLAENPAIDVVVIDAARGSEVVRRMRERRPDAAVLSSGALLGWVA